MESCPSMTSTMGDVGLSIAGLGGDFSKTQLSLWKYRDNDDAYLQSLGKRPFLKRAFGPMSILNFLPSALLFWESILVTSISGLLNGGPARVVCGFRINWIGTILVYTLGEQALMTPTSGGQCESSSFCMWSLVLDLPIHTYHHYRTAGFLTRASRRPLGSHDGASLLELLSSPSPRSLNMNKGESE